jgi:phosphotransferase system enzyme I (PtsI)
MSEPGAEKILSENRYEGSAASPGVATGPLVIFRPDELVVRRRKIKPEEVTAEIARLEQALFETRRQIQDIRTHLSESLDDKDASIFDAHLLVVEDATLIEAVKKQLAEQLLSVDYIYQQVTKSFVRQLNNVDDEYLRERASDIGDVSRRVLRNLKGRKGAKLLELDAPSIILAHDLTPSDTAMLDRKLVLGFITEAGSMTSHTAIMARSLNLPAVVGARDLVEKLESGLDVLLDGYEGVLIVHPSEQTKYAYGQLEIKRHAVEVQLDALRETMAITKDQRHIIVSANVELPEDLPLIQQNGAEGVGLYRTEFLYLNRLDFPSEDEQVTVYRQVAQASKPHSMIVRTLDVGGDKILANLSLEEEANPFLGWRGIRLCLGRPDIFKTQLRAICRAAVEGNVRVMFPMITALEELHQAKAMLREVQEELKSKNVEQGNLEIGIMIEVPSAALIAEQLAKEVDFFSIGTNDLIGYTLAVDRVNEKVANLYQPAHPGLLRLIRLVVEAAHRNNIWVGVCGEMAGDIVLTAALLGLGVDELSTGSIFVPRIKRVIQSLSYEDCRRLSEELMNNGTAEQNEMVLRKMAKELYSELF